LPASHAARAAPGRGGRTTRPNSIPGIQVLDESRPTLDLARDVQARDALADDAVTAGGLRRGGTGRVAFEQAVVGHVPVARRGRAPIADLSVGDVQLERRHAEAPRGVLDQDRARFRAGDPQRAAAVLDRQAPRGDALVGARRRRRRHDADAFERDVQLVCGDLSERGEYALAQLDLARRD